MAAGEPGNQRPFPAYRGTDAYVFVCYSHHDTDAVHADLALLRSLGLRIWYDEGISPGSEWSEELARALEGATLVLFYATEASSASRHCRDEINFAHNRDKTILPIFLEDVQLPSGLELSLSSTQAIHRYKLDDDHYLDKMRDVLPAQTLAADAPAADRAPSSSTSASTSTSRPTSTASAAPTEPQRRSPLLATMGVVALLLIGLGWLYRDTLMARWIVFAADHLGNPIEQQIGFAESADGTRIAYGITGEGPPVLIVLGWATHLQEGFTSPAYDGQGVLALSSEAHRIIRYDGRGYGLSDREVEDFSLQARVADIEAVVAAAGLERFAMYAMSAGGVAAIAYAQKHPEQLVSLTLASTNASYDYISAARMSAFYSMLDTVAMTWDTTPAAVDLLIESFFPDAEGPLVEVFHTFITRSTSGKNIAGFFKAAFATNVEDLAEQITVPTLVIHAEADVTVPLEAGRRLASLIPGALFVIVPGNHNDGTGMTPGPRRIILDFIDETYAREAAAVPIAQQPAESPWQRMPDQSRAAVIEATTRRN